jgi:hypothetical protein
LRGIGPRDAGVRAGGPMAPGVHWDCPGAMVMNSVINSDLWAAFEDHVVWVAAALLLVAVL